MQGNRAVFPTETEIAQGRQLVYGRETEETAFAVKINMINVN
jgi:hypothetical protein